MNSFALICTALIIISLLILLYPIMKKSPPSDDDVRRARYQLHDSIVAELQADVASGRLSAAEYDASLAEAEARLVAEVGRAEEKEPLAAQVEAKLGAFETSYSPKWLIALIGLGLPLLAALLYLQLGNPAALNPQNRVAAPAMMDAAKIAGMVKSLEAKMALEPDNAQGWLMLARSYRTLARYDEAVQAYEKAWPLVQNDAGEMARFAGALAIKNDSFAGRPTQLLAKALEINASEPDALMLAGSAALQRGDRTAALAWWDQLLALLEPGSDDARWLSEEIRIVKEESKVASASAAKP